jgi:hypothetical protein
MGDSSAGLPTGSPRLTPFSFRPISPRSPRQSLGINSPRSRFSFRTITDRPSLNPDSGLLSDDESQFILPDFDATDEQPLELAPSFAQIVKTAAVAALSRHTPANASSKAFCTRAYSRFFAKLDEWTLKEAKRSRRKQPREAAPIDATLLRTARNAIDGLRTQGEAWERAAPDVAPIPLPEVEPPEDEGARGEAAGAVVEDVIFDVERLAQRVSRAYSMAQTLDLVGQEVAALMKAEVEMD